MRYDALKVYMVRHRLRNAENRVRFSVSAPCASDRPGDDIRLLIGERGVRVSGGALCERSGMAYAAVSKTVAFGHGGSTPLSRTNTSV